MKAKHRPLLRIGYLPTLYHTSFLLMGTGLLVNNDVEAEWTLFPSGPDLVNAMCDGRLDIGYVGLPPAIIGINKGGRLACIAGGHIEGTVMVAREGIRTIDQCRSVAEFLGQFSGAAIGCPPRGSIHDIIVNEMLKEHHIEDVHVRNYAWADFLPDALVEAEIAAAAGTPALAVAARRFSGAYMIMPPELIWPFNPSYGIVAVRDRVARNKDVFRRFLVVHEMACEMIRHHPYKCARLVARAIGVIDAGFIMDAFSISPKYCAALPPEYISATMKFVNVLKALGYISRRINEAEIFDASLISVVHPNAPHYERGLMRPSHDG
ncbi:MAG TPA: ABC transporter substrate-binding protein [Candidatus Acidoferrales bacterium]|nr:ABC transporter substrate-binding protein [Candidatus Acidoferrales bacterium]